jgi:uncharacterized protein YjiS (DUF1127 family)
MTMLRDLHHTVHRFVDRQRKRRQLRRELAQLDAMGSLDAVLADCGLVRSQVTSLIEGCSDSRELLDRMLDRLGIDASRLAVESLRDMTWTCTNCADRGKCSAWLAGTEEVEFRSFCPNAEQLDHALSYQPPRKSFVHFE